LHLGILVLLLKIEKEALIALVILIFKKTDSGVWVAVYYSLLSLAGQFLKMEEIQQSIGSN